MIRSRLKENDITLIVAELERWRDGQFGSKLTWAILEKNFGYTRQSLQSHVRIKSAFQAAKISLRNGLFSSRNKKIDEFTLLQSKIDTLQGLVKTYEKKEKEWLMRWQRIAYHIRAKGLNFAEYDRNITTYPTAKEVKNILSFYDKPLPDSGRK